MYFKISLILVLLLIVTGCQNNPSESGEMSDEQLMQGIIDAEKTDISMEQLPSQSRTVIIDDYYDYKEIDAKMASDMGYQVSMDSKGYKPGDHNEVYFNIKGRELKPNRDDEDKNGFKCFELVLPVTFIMPDGLSITVEDENGYTEIRTWYKNHPNSKEKPTLQYPVNIIYRDGTTKTINTDIEMRKYYRSCSYKDDDKKDWGCFRFVYPIIYIMSDGSTISMEDKDDWVELKSWYESNPELTDRPTLEYPVDITYQDGTTKTINNDEEMRSAKENCSD